MHRLAVEIADAGDGEFHDLGVARVNHQIRDREPLLQQMRERVGIADPADDRAVLFRDAAAETREIEPGLGPDRMEMRHRPRARVVDHRLLDRPQRLGEAVDDLLRRALDRRESGLRVDFEG